MGQPGQSVGATGDPGGAHPIAAAAGRARDPLLVLALAAALLLPGLARLDLWAPDEPRYAQVAEELRSMQSGASGLVLLHLNGEPYTQKPPLFFWLAALFGTPGGRVTELSARLPSALAGIGCALVTLALGRRLFAAPAAGLWGAVLLLTVQRFGHLARRAQLDVLLGLFELLALYAFWRLFEAPGSGRRERLPWLALLHGATALALLTKGPVGLLPYLVIVLFLAGERRLRELPQILPVWGLALGLGPALTWISAAVAFAPAGFFEEAFVDNVLARFFTGTAHVRPFYYFGYQLPLDLLPWTPLLVAAIPIAWRAARRPHSEPGDDGRALRFLGCWLLTMLLFFSLSSGKRGLYLLPAYPAAALLGGAFLAAPGAHPRALRAIERGTMALLVVVGLAGAAIALAPAPGVSVSPGFVLPRGFGAVVLVLCALALFDRSRAGRRGAPDHRRLWRQVWAIAAIELAAFTLLYPAFDPEKSPRPIAAAAAGITSTHDPVGVYRHRALTGGVTYYSGRRAVALETPDDLDRFVRAGGRAVVVEARNRPPAGRLARAAVRAESRHGRRKLLLLELPEDGPR